MIGREMESREGKRVNKERQIGIKENGKEGGREI